MKLRVILAIALSLLTTTAYADPSPTATATLLNTPTYAGYASIRVTIDGHVKFPAGVVWCSQYVGMTRTFYGYWERWYPPYRKTMDVTADYGPLMTPSPDGVTLEGEWDSSRAGSCSFIVFAEAQGKNGKGPFAIDGSWFPFTVPAYDG